MTIFDIIIVFVHTHSIFHKIITLNTLLSSFYKLTLLNRVRISTVNNKDSATLQARVDRTADSSTIGQQGEGILDERCRE